MNQYFWEQGEDPRADELFEELLLKTQKLDSGMLLAASSSSSGGMRMNMNRTSSCTGEEVEEATQEQGFDDAEDGAGAPELKPTQVLKTNRGDLTEYEQAEILDFSNVWFLGAPIGRKIRARPGVVSGAAGGGGSKYVPGILPPFFSPASREGTI